MTPSFGREKASAGRTALRPDRLSRAIILTTICFEPGIAPPVPLALR